MPAINVARTDTFEVQRQKINQIGEILSNISAGGSDLQTGNLKLGDGTRTTPSLAFINESGLGIYRPDLSSIGFVSGSKKLFDITEQGIYSFKDLIVQRKVLTSQGISILSSGSNYDSGTYADIALKGGTGSGATAQFTVTEYVGTTLNSGVNYNSGTYGPIPLVGGNGTGAEINFAVPELEVSISNAGSGYVPSNYFNVPLSSVTGIGSGSTANINIVGNIQLSGSITNSGSGYTQGTGTYSQVIVPNNPRTTYTVTSIANPGTPPPDNVYQINGVTQQTLTLEKGNTYRFDISDPSMNGHPFIFEDQFGQVLDFTNYTTIINGVTGTPGAEAYLVIQPDAPTETIRYDCSSHDGMGATISIVAGTEGQYGTGASATVTVNGSGQITSFTFDTSGIGYKQNDILILSPASFGGTGSGFQYTLASPTYTGEISTIDIIENGQDYLQGDVLSVAAADVGGFGSGFEVIVTSRPGIIDNVDFTNKGSNYDVDDVLTLPVAVSGITTNLNGEVSGVSTTLNSASPIVNVPSTTNLSEGMDVTGSIDDVGLIAQGTTIQSINSSTQITLSQNPDASGAATLTFRSVDAFNQIVVSSVEGIANGYAVTQTGGTGALPDCVVIFADQLTNTITLSEQSTLPGTATLTITPDFGVGSTPYEFQIDDLGAVEEVIIIDGGNGYSVGDVLTIENTDLSQPIEYSVTNKTLQRLTFSSQIADSTFSVGGNVQLAPGAILGINQTSVPSTTRTTIGPLSTTLSDSSPSITVSSTAGIVAGMQVNGSIGDAGTLTPGTFVQSVDSGTQLTLTSTPGLPGAANLIFLSDESGTFINIASTSANGINATFNVTREIDGSVSFVTLNTAGSLYQSGDTVTILGSSVGGSSPTHNIILEVDQVTSTEPLTVYEVNSSGGFIDDILVLNGGIADGDLIVKQGFTTPYTIDTATQSFRFFLDVGNGEEISPSFTLYVGDTYRFDLSDASNSGHEFSLSQFPDGVWEPSLVDSVVSTLETTSSTITVPNTTNIVSGMEVTVQSGTGELVQGTTVESVDGPTTLTLSSPPLTAGPSILSFRGTEYTDGVIRESDSLTIKITDSTPNLYYYCATLDDAHADEGGTNGAESLITIDSNNTRVFGSGLQLSAAVIDSTDVITNNISTGELTAITLTSEDVNTRTLEAAISLSTPLATIPSLTTTTISSTNLAINATNTRLNSNFEIGTLFKVNRNTGALETSGELKTFQRLNVNETTFINNNVISTAPGFSIVLDPPIGQVVSIAANTAFQIPSGTESDKPSTAYNGYIRFNTETNQYEGFSETSGAWSSLGGVRDLDGNTTILAEQTIGANDNNLWFINDNVNSIRFSKTHQEFVNAKRIRSVNTSAPSYITWTANKVVTAGQYLRYKTNVYEVVVGGSTATTGNEPTNTTGNNFTDGTATLRYVTTSAAPLIFEEISLVRFAENVPVSINNDLRLTTNTISSDISDITIKPFTEKKVVIDATTSLVIPVGDNNQKGAPSRGSIRYNTSNLAFEGYDGVNWGSLGGVKDVDQNTYIIPETAPGENENILYFYNDNNNTLRLTTTQLEFSAIDTIVSTESDTLNIDVSTVTFDSLATTIDNTSSTTTFITTSKDNLDFGISTGLNNDHLLRLKDTGEIVYNLGFGTGTPNNLTLLNQTLTNLELKHTRINTSRIILKRGTINTGNGTVYNTSTESSSKILVTAHNTTTGAKELIEYFVTHSGSDIYFTDYNNIKTGAELVSTSFDIDPSNNVRITFTLSTGLTVGNDVEVTIINTVTKR